MVNQIVENEQESDHDSSNNVEYFLLIELAVVGHCFSLNFLFNGGEQTQQSGNTIRYSTVCSRARIMAIMIPTKGMKKNAKNSSHR